MDDAVKVETTEEGEQTAYFEPKVIFNGECDHDYQVIGEDDEGYLIERCSKCPMGRRML